MKNWQLNSNLPEWYLYTGVAPRKVSKIRPVSHLCACSKLMEHIIYSRLVKDHDENDLFNPTQHGFGNESSCDTQLVEF